MRLRDCGSGTTSPVLGLDRASQFFETILCICELSLPLHRANLYQFFDSMNRPARSESKFMTKAEFSRLARTGMDKRTMGCNLEFHAPSGHLEAMTLAPFPV